MPPVCVDESPDLALTDFTTIYPLLGSAGEAAILWGRGVMKTILAVAAILASALPAHAQTWKRRPVAPPNPTIIRNPPSMNTYPGPSVPTTSSVAPMYPKSIKRDYDPNFSNPTLRNPNLIRRSGSDD